MHWGLSLDWFFCPPKSVIADLEIFNFIAMRCVKRVSSVVFSCLVVCGYLAVRRPRASTMNSLEAKQLFSDTSEPAGDTLDEDEESRKSPW